MILILLLILLIGLTPLLGHYMAKVLQGEYRFLLPFEVLLYRIGGVNPEVEMGWKRYLKSLLLFNLVGFVLLFLIVLPLPWHLAFNIAMSFVTNTNWQSYAGETTLNNFQQMVGLTVQNFMSAASGMAALLVLIRGIKGKKLGNFWQDLVRTVVYILLPLSIVFAIFLATQGVVQSFKTTVEVTTLEGEHQTVRLGPVASQIAIKQLGTNGGGFFNTNSAHPFENPNAITNFLELLAILLIPAASTYTYGVLIGSKKQGWLLFLAMLILWGAGVATAFFTEHTMEGKEARIGILGSILWGVSSTATCNGSVNAMLSSFSPLAGGVCLFNIMLGEIIFGGVGVGLTGMLMFVFLTVFLTGLMVGRTPEYLGKKIERVEMQWVSVAILVPILLVLTGAGLTSKIIPFKGPHGLSEILYAFTSCSGNNGSSFAGLDANNLYYNLILGVCMCLGRLSILLPSLAIAGSLAEKTVPPESAFPTNSFLFLFLLMGVIVIVGALTFFPALCLGPIVEFLLG